MKRRGDLLRSATWHRPGLRGPGLAAAFALALAGCGGTQTAPPAQGKSVLVRVRSGTDLESLARQKGSVLLESDAEGGIFRLSVPPGESADGFLRRLSGDSRFELAESDDPVRVPESAGRVTGDPIHQAFDFVRQRDPSFFNVSATRASETTNLNAFQQVHLGATHERTRGAGITIAFLDTGVAREHPDLSPRLLPGFNALQPGAAPEDAADGVSNAAFGHGTMVAGILARIAPEAKLLPVRVLDADGAGSVLGVVRGIRYAVAQGARVLSLSFGSTSRSRLLEEAIDRAHDAGVVVVAAAGNDGQELRHYPAALRDVLAVAAVDPQDRKASFSNYGSFIALAAPGTGIRSAYPDGYASWSGTSFATPFVAGAAALVLAAHPELPRKKIEARLQSAGRSLDSSNPDYAGRLGGGVVDIENAVQAP